MLLITESTTGEYASVTPLVKQLSLRAYFKQNLQLHKTWQMAKWQCNNCTFYTAPLDFTIAQIVINCALKYALLSRALVQLVRSLTLFSRYHRLCFCLWYERHTCSLIIQTFCRSVAALYYSRANAIVRKSLPWSLPHGCQTFWPARHKWPSAVCTCLWYWNPSYALIKKCLGRLCLWGWVITAVAVQLLHISSSLY